MLQTNCEVLLDEAPLHENYVHVLRVPPQRPLLLHHLRSLQPNVFPPLLLRLLLFLQPNCVAPNPDVGLVYITNTGLTDMADQRALSSIIMGTESEYEGGANSRNRNSELANVYDIGAPIEAALAYHHEMTYKSHSIETLGFLCKHAVNRDDVGWSYVSDSVKLMTGSCRRLLGKSSRRRAFASSVA